MDDHARFPRRSSTPPDDLLDRAFSRAAGAPRVGGNRVRLLKDAAENYPAWLTAIHSAKRTVHFESYIIYDDAAGAEFAEAFIDRARAGVAVRVLYDWIGAVGKTSPRFWRDLSRAGVEVRCVNPPRALCPLDLLHRDHRKSITVDGRVGFVSGLCVGQMWMGDPARGIEPWRDTGIEIRGPAVADIARAFGELWAMAGPSPTAPDLQGDSRDPDGDVALRIVATAPRSTRNLRLDHLVAAASRETLWLTDPYFLGTGSYIEALRAAAQDEVDVRLLVPGATDIPMLRPISQAGYRPLLDAGIRIFQWRGPMLHAKTSVADGRWGRVGSTNLNLASWVTNYELDVLVEDVEFAGELQRMYLVDLENTTELTTRTKGAHRRVEAQAPREPSVGWNADARHGPRPSSRKASGVTAGALRLGNAMGAAIAGGRALATAEDRIVAFTGMVLLTIAVVAVLWPRLLTIPVAIIAVWLGTALVVKAISLRRHNTG